MIRLSASAFDILWSELGHERPPAPLRVRSVGRTRAERAAIAGEVHVNLADRGLWTDGEPHADVRARLELLAGADVYVACEALLDVAEEEPVRAVAAARGSHGVLAVQPSRTVGLDAITAGEVFRAAVGVLPALEPGPGLGVSLPSAVLASSADPVYADEPADRASRPYQQQVREMLAIQARPMFGGGQFSVRVREHGGVRRVGGVSWFVTDVGAYLGTVERGRGAQEWTTVAPADHERLAARLSDLLTAVRG